MIILNVKISAGRLELVAGRSEVRSSPSGLSKVYGQAARERRKEQILDEVMIASDRDHYPRCRCEQEHGLVPGITMRELGRLGGGCTDPQFVCPRLDRLRRRLGF